jgi:hypothetical protein
MKHFYPTTYFQFSSLVSKPICFLAASIIIFSGTAIAQKGNDEKPGTPETKTLVKPESVQSFLPGTLVDWTVKIEKNKVVLGWTTTIETNAVHFTIEKSFNGVDYTDAAVLSAAGNSNSRKQYAFTEKLSHNASKNIFYRLKMLDKDANLKYSDVRTIRASAQEQVKLEIYPNPAVNDLKLTVGASWVNQKLMVQVYNINGILVKTKVNEYAKETELLTVSDLPKGLYVVKVSNGSSSGLLRFVKN